MCVGGVGGWGSGEWDGGSGEWKGWGGSKDVGCFLSHSNS